MIEYLKDTYLSKTACRLLRVKLDRDLLTNKRTIKYFNKITFTTDVREKLYCLINGISIRPKCGNKSCDNEVKFLDYSRGYRVFCCIRCSKNPERLKTINIFGGVHKIRETPHTEKTLYFKKVREVTRLTYRMNKDKINPDNHKFGRCGVEGAYQLDHIISVNTGYKNGIDPEIIGGIDNLRIVHWRVNAVKNKFETEGDWHKIVTSYKKKEFRADLCVEKFIRKYCLNKSSRVNTKINYQWFINRNIEGKAKEIIEMTSYLDTDERMPFRIFNILFKLHETKYIIKGSRTLFIRDKWEEARKFGIPEV